MENYVFSPKSSTITIIIIFNTQNDLLNTTIYDLAYEEDHTELYNLLLNPTQIVDPSETSLSEEKKLIFNCHLKRSALDYREEVTYELVQFVGYFSKMSNFFFIN